MALTGRIYKRALEEKKKRVGEKKDEKEKNAADTTKSLNLVQGAYETLQRKAQSNPEKGNKLAEKAKELKAFQEQLAKIRKEQEAIEAEQKRLDEMVPMDEDKPMVTGESPSSPAQPPETMNQAELKQEDHEDINVFENENNSGNVVDSEDELPPLTADGFKERIGMSTTKGEAVAWKNGGGRGEITVIKRYGPKSHPKFRIGSPDEGFDPNAIPRITQMGYRIGEQKNEDGTWRYDYNNVVGLVAVAFKERDSENPLQSIDPAWYAAHPKVRYAETQVWIQWKNIDRPCMTGG